MHGVGTNGLIASQQYDASFRLRKGDEECQAPRMRGRVEGSGSSWGQGYHQPIGTKRERFEKRRAKTLALRELVRARQQREAGA